MVRERRDVPRRTPGEGIAFPQPATHRLSRHRHRRDVHRPHLPGTAPFRPTRRARGLRALARTPGRPGCAAAILGERARARCLRGIANDAPAPTRWVVNVGRCRRWHAGSRNSGNPPARCVKNVHLSRGSAGMYSEEARAARRCRGTTKAGLPCRSYALWGDTLCVVHARPGPRGPQRLRGEPPPPRRSGATCRCAAYAWPHRPGGGLCRWPEEPEYRLTTPAGTHSPWRRP